MPDEEDEVEIEDDVEETFFDLHFTLGLWIRNNWIYPAKEEELKRLVRCFVNPDDINYKLTCYAPDLASSIIIKEYLSYLRRKP